MIKLLLQSLLKYIDNGYKRIRASNKKYTVVIYEVIGKDDIAFTRIDIFTRDKNA